MALLQGFHKRPRKLSTPRQTIAPVNGFKGTPRKCPEPLQFPGPLFSGKKRRSFGRPARTGGHAPGMGCTGSSAVAAVARMRVSRRRGFGAPVLVFDLGYFFVFREGCGRFRPSKGVSPFPMASCAPTFEAKWLWALGPKAGCQDTRQPPHRLNPLSICAPVEAVEAAKPKVKSPHPKPSHMLRLHYVNPPPPKPPKRNTPQNCLMFKDTPCRTPSRPSPV